MKLAAAAVGLCLALLAPEARAACPDVAIEFSMTAISPVERERLERDLRDAVAKVCAWWGPTFAGKLTIDAPERDGPSMALIPAWRGKPGTMVFPAAVVRRGRAAVTHEVVHLFAPNANRFLAEGLAVHAHDRLGGAPAFPNFGRDLHSIARKYAHSADMVALDRLPTPAVLQLPDLPDRQAAYLVSGSFVRHLAEQHGMDKFQRLYAMSPFVAGQRNAGGSGRWLEIYGVTLDQLAQAWRGRLASAQ